MSPTRRDLFRRTAATVAAVSIATLPTVPVGAEGTRPSPSIDPLHIAWRSSLAIVRSADEYLVNEMSLAITPAGVSFIVSDAAPLSERRTIESTDPAVVAFLSDVVKAMRELQYGKRPLDKQLTKEQWKQVAAKQLDGERLRDIVLT